MISLVLVLLFAIIALWLGWRRYRRPCLLRTLLLDFGPTQLLLLLLLLNLQRALFALLRLHTLLLSLRDLLLTQLILPLNERGPVVDSGRGSALGRRRCNRFGGLLMICVLAALALKYFALRCGLARRCLYSLASEVGPCRRVWFLQLARIWFAQHLLRWGVVLFELAPTTLVLRSFIGTIRRRRVVGQPAVLRCETTGWQILR